MTRPHKFGTAVIELSSGKQLDLADPDPSVIEAKVVAHHLSNVCRFAGAVRRPYSVGEHTLLVVAYLETKGASPEVILSGLHHDDGEAFVGDMTRPCKELVHDFKPVEERVLAAVAAALHFNSWEIDTKNPQVKEADLWAMAAEAFYLMPTRGREWHSWGWFDPSSEVAQLPEIQKLRMSEVSAGTIRNLWMRKHMELIVKIEKERQERAVASS